MQVGLVGCGFIANVHSWALWAVRKAGAVDVDVTCVCDHDADKAARLAKPHGADVTDLDTMLASVDVVFICTPTATHAELVEAAAERGLAIFCEKPLAPSLEQARAVSEALRRVPHQVGLVLRASPVFDAMREAVASGRHGRPITCSMRDDQFFPIQGHYASSWRADHDMAGGGTLIEHSIHDVDLFRMLLGDPTDVTCRTASFFGHPGIEDLAVTAFGYDGGLVANLVSVWHQVMTRPSTRRLEVFCEEGLLWTEDDNLGPLHVQTSAGEEVVEQQAPPWTSALDLPEQARIALGPYAEATRRFLAGIAAGEPTSPGADEALAAHVLVDAAYRSAGAGGAPVHLA